MFTRILCPIDGSSSSLHALDLAVRCARDEGASLTVCTVVDPTKAAAMTFGNPAMSGPCLSAIRADAQRMVNEVAQSMRAIYEVHAVTLTGNPVDAIVSYADENGYDLIVIGSHRRYGIPRVLLGGVAEGVLHHAGVPVLIDGYHDTRSYRARETAVAAASVN